MSEEALAHQREHEEQRERIEVPPPSAMYRPAYRAAGPGDELWEEYYTRAYRRMFRAGTRTPRPYSLAAAVVADVVLWRMIPESHRPEDWPKEEKALAHHHGISPAAVSVLLRQSKYHLWAKISPFGLEERIRAVDAKVYDKAIRELEGGSAKVEATRLFYQRHGLLESGKSRNLTVNVGPSTTVNVQLKPEDARKELTEMLRYARLSGLEGAGDLEGEGHAVVDVPHLEVEGGGEVPPEQGGHPGSGERPA